MASIIDMSGVHMSVLSEFTNFKCDFATWKGSLKCCDKCLWITHWLHYCLMSLNLWSLGEIPLWWSCQCAQVLFVQNLRFLLVHSFSAPSLAVNGRVGCKFTPTVVRRGQTDWLRRLLCGNPGGTSRAWKITPRHPTHRGPTGSPPCSVASWVDGCAAPPLRWRLGRCDDAVK